MSVSCRSGPAYFLSEATAVSGPPAQPVAPVHVARELRSAQKNKHRGTKPRRCVTRSEVTARDRARCRRGRPCLPSRPMDNQPLKVGQQAPDFELMNENTDK